MSQKTGKTITSKISAPISNHRNQSIRKGTLCNVLCLASFSENKGRGITATTRSSVGEIVPFIVEPSLSPTMKWLRQKCSQARSHFKVLFLRSHSLRRVAWWVSWKRCRQVTEWECDYLERNCGFLQVRTLLGRFWIVRVNNPTEYAANVWSSLDI